MRIIIMYSDIMSRKLSLLGLCLALSWMGTACSSSKSPAPPTALQFTSPTASPTLELTTPPTPPETVTFTVNQDVNWSVQSGCGFGQPVGTLTNTSATSATYNAPATFPSHPPSCNPWQDLVVATSGSNASVSLAVTVVSTPPAITNNSYSSNTFTGENCTSGGLICACPEGEATCCPPPSTSTIIQLPSNPGTFGITEVGTYTQIGPLTAANGVPPYTWQMTSGTLPTGLTLVPVAGSNSTEMSITGTPVASGCSTFGMQITDANGVSSPTGPFAFNLVVIPPALKIAAPIYSSSYDMQGSSGGVVYPPLALTASSGTPPYTWVQDPTALGYTLPGGLALSASSSNSVTIQGTPSAGAYDTDNAPGGSPGQYPTKIGVSDGELPYPAVGVVSLSNMSTLQVPQPCSPTNQALPIQGSVPVPAEAYLQGSLAFMLRGFDANGPVAIAGSVGVDGKSDGGITGGELDVTRASGSQHFTIAPTGSYYVVGTTSFGAGALVPGLPVYSRGCMALATTSGTTTTFAFTLGGCSNQYTLNHFTATAVSACGLVSPGNSTPAGYFTTGHIIEFDDCTSGSASYCTSSTRATGILRWQDSSNFPTTGLSGPYAFGLSGWDAAAGHYAMAGSFQASSGSITSAAADIDDAGTVSSQLTGGTGTYSSVDPNGNSTGTLTVGPTSLPVSIYVVSANEAFVITTPPSAGPPILSGEAITTAGLFSNASLENSQMFHIGGVSSSGPDVSIGVLSFDGVSSVSGTTYEDQAGTLGTTAVSGSYSVDPSTGRTAFIATQGQTLGAHPFVAYVIPAAANLTRPSCSTPANCVTGFLVGTDSTAQDGVLEFQTPTVGPPPPFTNNYIAGDYAYGTDELLDQLAPAFEGDVYAQPSGGNTTSGTFGPSPGTAQPFIQDISYSCQAQSPQPSCLLIPSQALNGSYSISTNGTGTFGSTTSVTNGNVIFYIDESAIDLHPSIVVVEQ
jgi:hypothetical protein